MKKSFRVSFILIFVWITHHSESKAQFSRGAIPGEIYISTDWYLNNYIDIYYAIIYSSDNGESISIKYSNIENPPVGEMKIAKVLGDATQGSLYNFGADELWLSNDCGENWVFIEDDLFNSKFFCGVIPGLIFKGNNAFYKSIDFGFTFELLPITVTCPFTEVGYLENEYFGVSGLPGEYYNFVHTVDYGQTYNVISLDTTIAFYQISGHAPKISRGSAPGEIYLVSWWPLEKFKIYYSSDTGLTWTHKFTSNDIDLYYWRVRYTAGREPGSFYVMRSTIESNSHVLLYIDYSSDYGETFTTYFHDLGLYVGIDKAINSKMSVDISVYPNPAHECINISWTPLNIHVNNQIQVHDIMGRAIESTEIEGEQSEFKLDVSSYEAGIYFVTLVNDRSSLISEKFIVNR